MKTKNLEGFLASPGLYRHVDLSHQAITDEGCQRIAEALVHAKQLVHLDLSYNHIEDTGVFELARVFNSIDTKLKTLYLGNNYAKYESMMLCMICSVVASDSDEVNFLPENHLVHSVPPQKIINGSTKQSPLPQQSDWCADTAFKEMQKLLHESQNVRKTGKKRMREDSHDPLPQQDDWFADITFGDSGDENITPGGVFDFALATDPLDLDFEVLLGGL